MKIAIDPGHNCHPDTGAVGVKGIKEDNLTLQLAKAIIVKLEASGHDCKLVLPAAAMSVSHSLRQRVSMANAWDAELYVSLHFNAFNTKAHGTEVFAISATGLAKSVVNEIAELGFFNRGVKDGKNLFVLSQTNMPAILIEGCFIDAFRDMNIYSPEKMAEAIFSGLTNYKQ